MFQVHASCSSEQCPFSSPSHVISGDPYLTENSTDKIHIHTGTMGFCLRFLALLRSHHMLMVSDNQLCSFAPLIDLPRSGWKVHVQEEISYNYSNSHFLDDTDASCFTSLYIISFCVSLPSNKGLASVSRRATVTNIKSWWAGRELAGHSYQKWRINFKKSIQ